MTLYANPTHAQAHFPPPPRLLREIRDDWWRMGQDMLQDQPELHEIRVASHGYQLGDHWEFWVIRGPNNTLLRVAVR